MMVNRYVSTLESTFQLDESRYSIKTHQSISAMAVCSLSVSTPFDKYWYEQNNLRDLSILLKISINMLMFYLFYINIERIHLQKYLNFMEKPIIKETDHLKKNYLCHINGPILFTAPHSKKLNRGGKIYNEKIRIHLRQIYSSYLATSLARQTRFSKKQCNSFCVWGKSSGVDEKDLDPNYLIKDNIQKSPFHQVLHKWTHHHISKAKDPLQMTPLLHVDIHGKMDRQNNCQIEVGLRCMQVHWDGNPLIEVLKEYFHREFGKVFDGMIFGKFQCKFNCECNLHGYWGDGIYTMNQQSIMMGIPSFQFEIPRKVRQKLFKDNALLSKFGRGINQIYQKIVTPWWKKMEGNRKLNINKQLALKAENNITYDQVDTVISQLEAMDRKAQLLLNVKFI